MDTGDTVITLLILALIFLILLGSFWCLCIVEGRRSENGQQQPEETRTPERPPPARATAKEAERASTAVARLDHVSYLRPQQSSAAAPEDGDCTICLGPFEDGQWCSVMPGCRHEFHKRCISGWFEAGNGTCSLCRAQLQWAEVAQDMV